MHTDVTIVLLELLGIRNVWTSSGIANLLTNEIDFVDGELTNGFSHPLRLLEFDNKLALDVVDDLVSEVFCFFREGSFDKEAAENPGCDTELAL